MTKIIGIWAISPANSLDSVQCVSKAFIATRVAQKRLFKATNKSVFYAHFLPISALFLAFLTRYLWVKPAGHDIAPIFGSQALCAIFGSFWIDAGERALRTRRQVRRSRRHQVSGAGLRWRQAERRRAEPTQVSWCRGVSILGPISAWQLTDPIQKQRRGKLPLQSMANAPQQF